MKRVMVAIIEQYLISMGFDGLYNTNKECACHTFDLHNCPESVTECVLAVKTECNCDDRCEFHLIPAEDKDTVIN